VFTGTANIHCDPETRTYDFLFILFKKAHVSRTRANFFSEPVVNSWNSLPDGIDFSSFPRFKRCINKVDFSRFIKCF